VRAFVVSLTFVFGIAAASVVAQQAGTQPFAFEVVSIRPNVSSSAQPGLQLQPSGRIIWTAKTLKGLIGLAYQRYAFDRREVIGGPEWMDRDRFDIIAQANGPLRVDPDGFPGPSFRLIAGLIEDRFQVRVHNEQRERPVYALVLSSSDGTLGPKLQKSSIDCAAEIGDQARGSKPRRLPDGRFACVLGNPPGRYMGTGLGLRQFAAGLEQFVERPIVDRTGLSGGYDWDVEFRPEFGRPIGDQPPQPLPDPSAFESRPSIFTAIQEQLGLRLESTRGLIDVLVVDHAEHPTPD
jgi:uncharacterized protein (TIGR03435 family)